MRLGRNAKISIRIFPAYTRPFWQRVNRMLIAWVFLLIFAIALTAGYRRTVSVVQMTAQRHATNLATRLIHEAINEQILKYNYTYSDFVTMRSDEKGQVQSLAVNPATVNKLKAEVALAVEKKVSETTQTTVCIPLGAFLSDEIAVGYGPRLQIKLAPMGYSLVDFQDSFTSVGINQTKHQIDIVVQANFSMISAFAGSGVHVDTTMPVAQTVIVGTVPNSYLNLQR